MVFESLIRIINLLRNAGGKWSSSFHDWRRVNYRESIKWFGIMSLKEERKYGVS